MIQDEAQTDSLLFEGTHARERPRTKPGNPPIDPDSSFSCISRTMILASAATPMRSAGVPAMASISFSCNHTGKLALHC